MAKAQIEKYLAKAPDALKQTGIVTDDKADKIFRGYIASFGAAVALGSLASAVCFFKEASGADKDRSLLMAAIYLLVCEQDTVWAELSEADNREKKMDEFIMRLFNSVKNGAAPDKEKIMDAAVALKLALNLYVAPREPRQVRGT